MFKKLIALVTITAGATCVMTSSALAQNGEYLSGMKWEEPPVVTPGKTNADPPSDAVVLFDGKDLSAWENGDKWIVKDGVAIVHGGDITTKQSFGDCQLHIEWSAPTPPTGHSQGRGNSGVFLQDHYEVQVLDSYKDKTYFDGQASAIYKQTPPMVNAMRPPGEWNTYDIVWIAPKFKDNGSLESPAYISVLHNGVLTLNHFEVQGATPFNQAPKYEKHGKLPIHLQDHGNPVRYRNIWVREIKPIEGTREREPYFHDHTTGKDTPIQRKTSSIQNGSQPDIESLAGNSTINLGIGTPRLPGQSSGLVQSRSTTNLIGPSASVLRRLEQNASGTWMINSQEPSRQPELQTYGNSGGILTFESPSPKDKKAPSSK